MDKIIFFITSLLEAGGLGVFFWFLIRGLRREITSLNGTVEAQKKTLEVMEQRVSETEKVGNIYRKLINDLPEDLEKYNKVIRKTKDEVIERLEEAVKSKDEELKSIAEVKLREIEIQEKALGELPKLRQDLIDVNKALNDKLNTLSLLSTPALSLTGTIDSSPHADSLLSSYNDWMRKRGQEITLGLAYIPPNILLSESLSSEKDSKKSYFTISPETAAIPLKSDTEPLSSDEPPPTESDNQEAEDEQEQ